MATKSCDRSRDQAGWGDFGTSSARRATVRRRYPGGAGPPDALDARAALGSAHWLVADTAVHDIDAFDREVMAMARRLADGPPQAFATAKEAHDFLIHAPAPGVHLYQMGGLESKLATDYGIFVLDPQSVDEHMTQVVPANCEGELDHLRRG